MRMTSADVKALSVGCASVDDLKFERSSLTVGAENA